MYEPKPYPSLVHTCMYKGVELLKGNLIKVFLDFSSDTNFQIHRFYCWIFVKHFKLIQFNNLQVLFLGKADIEKIENKKPQVENYKSYSTGSEGQCIADCSR